MEAILATLGTALPTVGFPILSAVAIGFVFYKVIVRIMDENKVREENYQKLLLDYGEKMGEITSALAEMKGDISEIKNAGK